MAEDNLGEVMARMGMMHENGTGGVEQDIDMAVSFYLKSHDAGSAEGSCCLGVCYKFGSGVEQSDAEAKRLFQIAADKGHARGMNNLGATLQDEGNGNDAIEWYLKAAEAGDKMGLVSAGVLLDGGSDGVERDVDRAYVLFEQAVRESESDHVRARALRYIGYAYRDGDGVEQNHEKAVEYFEKALECGDKASSYFALGMLYLQPEGESTLPSDKPKALQCLEAACKDGHGKAGVAAAIMLENGDGVDVDFERAAVNYKRAVIHGEPMAFTYLGQAYEVGQGVRRDVEQALQLYEMGAKRGSSEGAILAGLCYGRGDGCKVNLKKAFKYFAMSSRLGNGQGTACLARAVRDGDGYEADPHRAAELFREAFDQGYAQALAEAGVLYENGAEGFPEDVEEANNCYRQAAEKGSGMGALYLGLNYESGKGFSGPDNTEACAFYSLGVSYGDARCMTCLGVMKLHGNGTPVDEGEAVDLFRRAAEEGDSRAMRNLAACYAQGRGVPTDAEAAMRWALQAAMRAPE